MEETIITTLHKERRAAGSRIVLAAIPSYRALNSLPPGAIVSLPIGGLHEYNYMFFSLYHSHLTFNGQSGFTPLLHAKSRELLQHFPDRKSIELLRILGINYAIVHKKRMPPG